MYKIIAIDIDGTLLNDRHEMTEGTKKALAEAVQKGAIVTLSTGRMYASAKQLAEMLDLNVPIISYQGALVKNLQDGEVLYARHVPQWATEEIGALALSRGWHLQLYCDDQLFVREDNEKVRTYARVSNVPYRVEADLTPLLKKPQLKLLIIEDEAVISSIQPELEEKYGKRVHITKSKPYFLEVTHLEATKGHALRHLANIFGVRMNEVIAIGDAWNDREMLEAAGLGVAMANAVPSLKAVADYITLSNNEEGVKHVIEKFVLQDPSSS